MRHSFLPSSRPRGARWSLALALAMLAAPTQAAAASGDSFTISLRPTSERLVKASGQALPLRNRTRLCVAGAGSRSALLGFVLRSPSRGVVQRATLRVSAQTVGPSDVIELRGTVPRTKGDRTLPLGHVVSRGKATRRSGWVSLDATPIARRGGSTTLALTAARGMACVARRSSRVGAPKLFVRYARGRTPQGAQLPSPAGAGAPGVSVSALPAPPPWQLVFDDEFSGSSLNSTKWNNGYWAPGNGFYDPSNAVVQNGALRLRAATRSSSAMVQTKGKVELAYGRVEIMARVPKGQGLWPSLWMRPTDLSLTYPEIDLLEMWQTDAQGAPFDTRSAWMNYHWSDPNGVHRETQSIYTGPDDYTQGFHQFAIEWEPGNIRWYIDGVERKRVTGFVGLTVGPTPMYLVMGLQVGAWWLLGGTGEPSANTRFPADLDIDYVRAYRR